MIWKGRKRRNQILKEANVKGEINKTLKKIKMQKIAKNLNNYQENYQVGQAQKMKILYQLECSLRQDK